MNSDGFPERGWGSWRGWRDRAKKRLEEKHQPVQVAVCCKACQASEKACGECGPIQAVWGKLMHQKLNIKGSTSAVTTEALARGAAVR